MAGRRANPAELQRLTAIRNERFELMDRLAQLPADMVFYTQITMEAAEDPEFLDAMRRANIKGALVGVESVTPEGLKDVHKQFNAAGDQLVDRLRVFKQHGVHVLGSFIFGLPSDRPATFEATASIADQAGVTFAQFVMLTPFPGTLDFAAWEETMKSDDTRIDGIPLTRHWLIPQASRPKVYIAASGHDRRRDPRSHAGGVGSLLQPAAHLGTLALRQDAAKPSGLRSHLEAVSPDVRQYRDRHRQRAGQPIGAVGAPDREAVPPAVHSAAAPRPSESRRPRRCTRRP